MDRGYIAPSPNHLSSTWSHPHLHMEGLSNSSGPMHQLGNLEDFMQRAPASVFSKRASSSNTLASAGAQYHFKNKSSSTLVSAEVELRRLCLSQGWGAPSVHLTGQRVAASGFQVCFNYLALVLTVNIFSQVEFQASVMVIGLPTLLNGPWCLAK